MEVFPAPDGAVMMMILLLIGICKEKKKCLRFAVYGLRFLQTLKWLQKNYKM